jgi:putative endonuclease
MAITAAKRRRFSRAARAWLTRNPWAATKTWRADAVFIAPRRWPRHLEAAFELDIS